MENEKHPVLARLEEAARGLMYQSETDAPVEPFLLPESVGQSAEPATLLPALGQATDQPVKTQTLGRFFAPVTKEEKWHNEEERQTVKRFQVLERTLKENLTNIKVFKVGGPRSEVYIVGKTSGGQLAGVKTTVVET